MKNWFKNVFCNRASVLENNASQVLVSVVVPIYNVEKYIGDCLDSLKVQTLKNIEVICVDDCSPDASIKIVDKYVQKDDRFRIVTHKKNLGLGGARNTGIDNAKGKYIFFLDSDDLITEDALEVLYKTAERKNADIVSCNIKMFYDDGREDNFKNAKSRRYGWNILKSGKFEALNRVTWNKIYRRNIFENKSIRFTEKLIHEDVEFYWKCFLIYPKAFVIRNFLYYYRQRDNSIMSKKKPDDYFVNHAIIINNVYSFLNENMKFELYKKDFGKRIRYFIRLATRASENDLKVFFDNVNENIKDIFKKEFTV